jgi:hypothetical protein
MATRDSQRLKEAKRTKATPKLSTSGHHVAPSAIILKRPLPTASVKKAQKAFENFRLSKFTKKSLPANHVGEGKDASPVHVVQRNLISQKIQTLNNNNAPTQGMTLALTAEQIKSLLPSYREKTGTVELSDVLSLLTKKMKGTEFYSNGNPTLNRLALQSQVDQIIQSVKQESKR